MSINYTVSGTDGLITRVRTKGSFDDDTPTDAQILEQMTESLQTDVAPLIKSLMQENMVSLNDQTLVSGTLSYNIPTRAMNGGLRDVVFLDSNSNEYNVPLLNPDIIKRQSIASYWGDRGYYFQDQKVFLYLGAGVTTTSFPTIRMKYYRRPNNLVATSSAGSVVSIDSANSTVTLNFIPTDWTTSTTFDIVKGTPHFTSKGDDLTISTINGFDIVFDSLPSDIAVGDWVCSAGTSPIPQVSYEAFNLLCQITTTNLLEFQGSPKWVTADAQADKLREKLKLMMAPRVDGSPQTVVSKRYSY